MQDMSEDKARQLYEAAAEAGLAQQRPPAPEDHLTAAMQEQEEKLRVRALYDLSRGAYVLLPYHRKFQC